MNGQMAWLISGKWSGQMCANVGKALLEETLGPGKMAARHLSKRQGQWPKLSASTKKDKRKKDGRIFVRTGKVEKALNRAPVQGKLRTWQVGKGGARRKRFRYSANGMWSTAEVTPEGVVLAVGFAGRMTHSKQTQAARKKIAVERGVKLRGLTKKKQQSAIRKAVSVDEAVSRMKKTGGGRKFAGSKAKNNLAYASVLQLGIFQGVQGRGGKKFSAQEAARGLKKRDVKGGFHVMRGGKQRPLMPYDGGDNPMVAKALEKGVKDTFRQF